MKVELESSSSDSGEVDDAHFFQKNPVLDPRRKLWTTTKSHSDFQKKASTRSVGKKHSTMSDEDFEFVITRSSKAKKVKKSPYDSSDNYSRTDKRDNRNNVNGRFEGNHHDSQREKESSRSKRKTNVPRGHPGLERQIDFDPFESSSEASSAPGEAFHTNNFPGENKRSPETSHEFPPMTQEINHVEFDHPQKSPKRKSCDVFLLKFKSFLKSFGFRIKKCYTKSRGYLSRMVKNRKQRKRNKKLREPLIRNQSYDGEMESEFQPAYDKTVRRQKLDYPFETNSIPSLDEQEHPTKRKKNFPKTIVTKIKSLKKNRASGNKNTLRPVELSSFPDS